MGDHVSTQHQAEDTRRNPSVAAHGTFDPRRLPGEDWSWALVIHPDVPHMQPGAVRLMDRARLEPGTVVEK